MKVTTSKGKISVEVLGDDGRDLANRVATYLGIGPEEFYLTCNGKLVHNEVAMGVVVNVVPRVVGGKGGFGSMLRAIGAQIEKTTNRDACRDLSGRRLRDINEEQRLKRWFAKQKEREDEKKEARKRKLEKLKQVAEGPPLPKINDKDYIKQSDDMADSVYAAVDKGFEEVIKNNAAAGSSAAAAASSSSTSTGSSSTSDESSSDALDANAGKADFPVTTSSFPSSEMQPEKKKAFKKTMFDEDLDSSCSSSDESDDETSNKKAKLG